MRPYIRIVTVALALLSVAMLVASVGAVMPRSFRVIGPDGMPLPVWVAYRYEAGDYGLLFSAAWGRPGGIAESDTDGIVRLPMRIYLKAPLDRWLRHEVDLVHAPSLHSTLHGIEMADGATVTMADNRSDPEAWEHSLGEIHGFVKRAAAIGPARQYWLDHGTTMKLARIVASEYRLLLEAHGDRPRQMPTEIPGHFQFASEADRAAWQEQVRQQIEREPSWRHYLERRYGQPVGEFEERFGK